MIDWAVIGIPLAALGRSVAGWAGRALEDGKITKFELRELGTTIIRVSLIGSGVLGIVGISGAQADGLSVGLAAVLVDMFYNQLKKRKK